MKQSAVILKSNAYGLTLYLDAALPFEELLRQIADKFTQAARFFRNAQMALTFKGRDLSEEEEQAVIETITANSRIQIVCIVDEDPEHSMQYRTALMQALSQDREGRASVYPHTLTSGQTLENDGNLIILGDVNPGASVVAAGYVIVLGCCMGSVTAGFGGRRDVFVCALVLKPSLMKIADVAVRPAITKRVDPGDYKNEPKIAWVKDGHMALEPVRGSLFEKITEVADASET